MSALQASHFADLNHKLANVFKSMLGATRTELTWVSSCGLVQAHLVQQVDADTELINGSPAARAVTNMKLVVEGGLLIHITIRLLAQLYWYRSETREDMVAFVG